MPVSLAEMKARLSPDAQQKVERRTAELIQEVHSLQALRLALESTQVAVAEKLGVSQANVAKLEQRTDVLLSTLREYIEALGGELHLSAQFGASNVQLLSLVEETIAPVSRRHRLKPKRDKAAKKRDQRTTGMLEHA